MSTAAKAPRKPRLLITGADLAPQALALLDGFEVVYTGKTPSDEHVAALCREHDPQAVIVRYGRLGAEAIASAPSLKVISKHGSGTDNIDKAAAAARGIAVVAAAGANAAAVAEHAISLLLACAKSVIPLDARMRQGHWDKATHKSLELEGRTLGLVGLGAIGSRVARIAQAMGMQVLGFDPYAKAVPQGVQAVDLATLWRSSDAISLHCPLSADNANMLGAAALAQCKPGVILINTARGGLVDEAALLDAIHSGQVASAGLDSFAVEPMAAGHPFLSEPRIVLSPHIGGVSADAYVKMGVAAAQNVLAVLKSAGS